MSDETARALADANAIQARHSAEVEKLARESLLAVADDIVAKVDEYAKAVAHAQPEIAKTVGRDGITSMRGKLAAAAENLATDLRGASDHINWPAAKHNVSNVDIQNALYEYIEGPELRQIDAILKQHGFRITHGGISTHNLYNMNIFAPLASAFTNLANARAATARARAADDRATVESLWGE